jgi:hypothetical protein
MAKIQKLNNKSFSAKIVIINLFQAVNVSHTHSPELLTVSALGVAENYISEKLINLLFNFVVPADLSADILFQDLLILKRSLIKLFLKNLSSLCLNS